MTGYCAGCGTPLEPTRSGRPRKWCSDRCRKRTLYASTCPRCGAPSNLSGSAGNRPTLCPDCAKHANANRWLNNPAVAAKRERVAQMVRDGLSNREIAGAEETTVGTIQMYIHRLRARGYDLPMRRGTPTKYVNPDPPIAGQLTIDDA